MNYPLCQLTNACHTKRSQNSAAWTKGLPLFFYTLLLFYATFCRARLIVRRFCKCAIVLNYSADAAVERADDQ